MSDTKGRSVLLLCIDSFASRAIYSALIGRFGPIDVLVEDPIARTKLLRGRVRKYGVWHVLGQLLFQMGVAPLLRGLHAQRISELRSRLSAASQLPSAAMHVASVNSDEARNLLRSLSPQVVVVSGTRIISALTLESIKVPVINMHSGITPEYRGVHGGYWALVDGNLFAMGTTIHLVDSGIDTGQPIAYVHFVPEEKDSFVSYPYLHTIAGIPVLLDVVAKVLKGSLSPIATSTGRKSALRSHPTLW